MPVTVFKGFLELPPICDVATKLLWKSNRGKIHKDTKPIMIGVDRRRNERDALIILAGYLRRLGYIYLNGAIRAYVSPKTLLYEVYYYPSERDILFKRFPKWEPFKARREILFRRF